MSITLSDPVLVKRTKDFCWFPSLARLGNGDLLALMSATPDAHVTASVMHVSRSADGGATWSPSRAMVDGGYSFAALPDGDALVLPYYLRRLPRGIGSPANCVHVSGDVTYLPFGVRVSDWPRLDRSFAPELGLAGFVFNGQTVTGAAGEYLTTLYGYFGDDKRMSIVLAESSDAHEWHIRSIVAGHDCPVPGPDGPSESAMWRLGDGRLLCIFRVGSFVPFGRCVSDDDGRTWSDASAMPMGSVQPSLCGRPDGVVALSGGRPGVYAWVTRDPLGDDWQEIDIGAHHNAAHPEDAILHARPWVDGKTREDLLRERHLGFTSSYTEVIPVGNDEFLMIYDRLALGWHAIPESADVTNSVWAVRIRVA
jgi:hypothetical protein